jgi:predicted nuclease of predicted toxin-antitoxin system
VLEEGLGGRDDATIAAACQGEERTLVTLDAGFADIRAHPPKQYPGLIVLRLKRQDKPHVLAIFRRVLRLLSPEAIARKLWIVEEDRIRIRR